MPDATRDVSKVPVGKALRSLQPQRSRYAAEQVNFIRESFLLDGKGLPWLRANVWPESSESALYKIAIGKTYPEVPLTPRLQAAFEASQKKRAESSTGPEPESGAADPVRADELLDESAEVDWG